MKELLPIGSVVSLGHGGEVRIVLLGYYPIDKTDRMYEYYGTVYPFGIMPQTPSIMFDTEQIHEVLFRGYENDKSITLCTTLPELMRKVSVAKTHRQ